MEVCISEHINDYCGLLKVYEAQKALLARISESKTCLKCCKEVASVYLCHCICNGAALCHFYLGYSVVVTHNSLEVVSHVRIVLPQQISTNTKEKIL